MKQATFVANSSNGQKDRADWESHGIRNEDKMKAAWEISEHTAAHRQGCDDGSEDVICSGYLNLLLLPSWLSLGEKIRCTQWKA